jgi:hypothetical protein
MFQAYLPDRGRGMSDKSSSQSSIWLGQSALQPQPHAMMAKIADRCLNDILRPCTWR